MGIQIQRDSFRSESKREIYIVWLSIDVDSIGS